MGRTITVANQKGGVGKTTTVANLGAALAEAGHRTLMVDLDPQGALTAAAGLDPYHLSPTTYSLLMKDEIQLEDILRFIRPGLWIAPASVDLGAVEYTLTKFSDRSFRLKQKLMAKRDALDYVLIDTPPNLGLLTTNALVASDELLIPVQCQYLAMRGVRSLLETVWLVHDRLHPGLKLLGLLPTLYQPESDHSCEVVQELRRVFGERVFETVIMQDDAAAMAPAARKSILDFRPDSPAAAAYRRLAEEVSDG
jgi:chromosome partitioning protein